MTTSEKYFITDLVEEVGSLPSVAAKVVSLTSDPQCDIAKLAKIILSDSVMTMRFLALANSAALSRGQEIRDLRSALVRLGLRRVRNVAFLMGMHDLAPSSENQTGINLQDYWNFSLACASCAQGLAWQRGNPPFEDAWLVGILHGIGVMALTQKAGEELTRAMIHAKDNEVTLADAEMVTLDFHHGEIGAGILANWGLPKVFVEAVEFHCEDFEPGEVSEDAVQLISVLRDATRIVRAIGFGENGDGTPVAPLEEVAADIEIEWPTLEALSCKVDREVGEMSRLLGVSPPPSTFSEAIVRAGQMTARLGLQGVDAALVKENLEEQMSMARDIQQRLLPVNTPELDGLKLAAVNEPSHLVSGDLYDFITLQGGLLGLCIADVSGKGMPASLLASNLQASIRALAMVFNNPGELLTAVNKALFESTDFERFATLFLAVLRPDGSGFSYASAGHNPPLLMRHDNTCTWLRPAGTPLGMVSEMSYPVTEVDLGPGDMLVAYTDGITEAADQAGIEFSEEGLEQVVRGCFLLDPGQVIEQVIGAVRNHAFADGAGTGGNRPVSPTDDLTMLVLKRLHS